jgi:hypothetical protein
LQGLVQQAIEANLDMALFEEERRLQDVEHAHLGELRSKVRAMLAAALGE